MGGNRKNRANVPLNFGSYFGRFFWPRKPKLSPAGPFRGGPEPSPGWNRQNRLVCGGFREVFGFFWGPGKRRFRGRKPAQHLGPHSVCEKNTFSGSFSIGLWIGLAIGSLGPERPVSGGLEPDSTRFDKSGPLGRGPDSLDCECNPTNRSTWALLRVKNFCRGRKIGFAQQKPIFGRPDRNWNLAVLRDFSFDSDFLVAGVFCHFGPDCKNSIVFAEKWNFVAKTILEKPISNRYL